MIKISRNQIVPRFYIPIKYSVYTTDIECYLFFIAPFAFLYEKIINTFYFICSKLLIEDEEIEKQIINIIESCGVINTKTHKLELDTFELNILERKLKKILRSRK